MKDRILEELRGAYPDFVSGPQLAQSLNISRVAVWKHIEALKQAGYDIVAVKGKGYRLLNAEQVIIPSLIRKHLHDSRWGSPLYSAVQTESTNLWARQLQDLAPLIRAVVLVSSSMQTVCRGRMVLKWSSPPWGLYFSIILRPTLDLQRASLLSLVLAVACARSLQKFINYPCGIKWPNDVMINGLKTGGILLEASGEMDSLAYVVAGVGINVNLTPPDLPVEVRSLATSLTAVTGQNYDINLLAAHLLNDLQQDYDFFLQEGFPPFLEAYKQHCIHLLQPISVNTGKCRIKVIIKEIDDNFNLLIEVDGKLLPISTGDVQLVDFQGEQ